jgi:HPt (histidine-containing phosphotransfer) domain-containing protein
MVPRESPSSAINESLKRIWRENREVLAERVAILRNAAHAAGDGSLRNSQRAEAKVAAHNLAGSLGMFGLSAASEHARQIEAWLEQSAPNDSCRIADLVEFVEQSIQKAFGE